MTAAAASSNSSSGAHVTQQSFDPTDLKYQVSKDFLPDKASLYKHPLDHDGWIHAHNGIRAELIMLEECFKGMESRAKESPELSEWEVLSLKNVCEGHFVTIHAHHTNEDKILAPRMLERAKYPEKLTVEHEGIIKQLDVLGNLVSQLKPGDNRAEFMAKLLQEWKIYGDDLKPHLLEEEEIGLPLMRAYFTPKEYGAITQEIIKNNPPLDMGSIIYHMGVDRFRKEFMPQEGIPFFVWYLVFSPGLKLYEREVIQHVNALKSGVEPVPQKKRWFGLLG